MTSSGDRLVPRVRLDSSLEAIEERAVDLTQTAVLATIVGTTGSTYRKAGARMIIEADGRLTGLLSGGCLERDLTAHAAKVLASDAPLAIEYDMRGDDELVFGIGAGCGGALRLLLEPFRPDGRSKKSLRSAVHQSRNGCAVVLATVHQGPVENLGTYVWQAGSHEGTPSALSAACESAWRSGVSVGIRWSDASVENEAWLQLVRPLPWVLICGAGPDVEPLFTGLRQLRFRVTILDHRSYYLEPSRFPGADLGSMSSLDIAGAVGCSQYLAAVVMSHHLPTDTAYLRALATTDIPYVGVLGPRRRLDRILSDLGPLAARLAPRIRGPVGLNIGAATPEGIALAISAELHSVAAQHADKRSASAGDHIGPAGILNFDEPASMNSINVRSSACVGTTEQCVGWSE